MGKPPLLVPWQRDDTPLLPDLHWKQKHSRQNIVVLCSHRTNKVANRVSSTETLTKISGHVKDSPCFIAVPPSPSWVKVIGDGFLKPKKGNLTTIPKQQHAPWERESKTHPESRYPPVNLTPSLSPVSNPSHGRPAHTTRDGAHRSGGEGAGSRRRPHLCLENHCNPAGFCWFICSPSKRSESYPMFPRFFVNLRPIKNRRIVLCV